MSLLQKIPTKTLSRLRANYEANNIARNEDQPEIDHHPVLKIFVPFTRCKWLLTEYDANSGLFFGLCDLGYPELGYVALSDLDSVSIAIDTAFSSTKTLSKYADDARKYGCIRS